jgi:hypothetical protein
LRRPPRDSALSIKDWFPRAKLNVWLDRLSR